MTIDLALVVSIAVPAVGVVWVIGRWWGAKDTSEASLKSLLETHRQESREANEKLSAKIDSVQAGVQDCSQRIAVIEDRMQR